MNIIFYIVSFIILFKIHNNYVYYCVFVLFIVNIIYEIYQIHQLKIYNYLFPTENKTVPQSNNEIIEPSKITENVPKPLGNVKLTAKNINSLIKEKYTK